MTFARRAFWLPVLASFVLDQTTKQAALAALAPGVPVALLPGFNLTLGFNQGASFGLLSGVMSGRPLAMAGLTAALTVVFAIIGLRAGQALERAGFALIVGGSLGNITDRLRQGAVTDFLDVFWREWHWPAFNMADVAITCGAGLILLSALPRFRKDVNRA